MVTKTSTTQPKRQRRTLEEQIAELQAKARKQQEAKDARLRTALATLRAQQSKLEAKLEGITLQIQDIETELGYDMADDVENPMVAED